MYITLAIVLKLENCNGGNNLSDKNYLKLTSEVKSYRLTGTETIWYENGPIGLTLLFT